MYTACADDSTFFLNDLLSAKNLTDIFTVFSLFWGLKASFSKYEIAGLGSLKRVLEAVWCLKSINLTTNTKKILGVHLSWNGTLKVQNHFLDTVKSIQQVLCFWNRRMLSLEARIIIFKTLTISKIFCLVFLTAIPNSLIEGKNGGLKNVDVSSKTIRLHYSWLQKPWKLSWMENNSFSPYKQILWEII